MKSIRNNEYNNQLMNTILVENQLQSSINNDIQNDIICNSSKLYTLPCNKKCRTVGIFLLPVHFIDKTYS